MFHKICGDGVMEVNLHFWPTNNDGRPFMHFLPIPLSFLKQSRHTLTH